MKRKLWLLKSEPSTYSYSDLEREGETSWNGVRNFQARNFIREMGPGDLALIYQSGDDRAVVGIAEVAGTPFPDLDPKKKGDWLQVKLKPKKAFKTPVSLTQIKSNLTLRTLPLLKQSRLSVMPITEEHFKTLLQLGGTPL